MDNKARTKSSREIVIKAAVSILVDEGMHRLTLDRIASKANISKGRLMHHYKTKQSVIDAILEEQVAYFEISKLQAIKKNDENRQKILLSNIEVLEQAESRSRSMALALLRAMLENHSLTQKILHIEINNFKAISYESENPDEAALSWMAAKGLLLTSLLGICPLDDNQRKTLFAKIKATTT